MDDTRLNKSTTEFISSRDAAALYGVSHDHISRLCRQGKILGLLQGGVWLVEKGSVCKFFQGKRKLISIEISRGPRGGKDVLVYSLPVAPVAKIAQKEAPLIPVLTPKVFGESRIHYKDARNVVSLRGKSLGEFLNSELAKKTTAFVLAVAIVFGSAFGSQSEIARANVESTFLKTLAFGKNVAGGVEYVFSQPILAFGTLKNLVSNLKEESQNVVTVTFNLAISPEQTSGGSGQGGGGGGGVE